MAGKAEQAGQRLGEQPGLEVPQGDIHRGDGGRRHAGPADVADLDGHGLGQARGVEGVPSGHHVGEHLGDDDLGRGRGVAPAEPLLASGPRPDQHHGRLVPGQCAVGLGFVGRYHVDGRLQCRHNWSVHQRASR